MDAFVLAGDRGTIHPILGANKALLRLEGYPLFIHVLKALDEVPEINRVYIIGPQKKMMEEIERALPYTLFLKKIEVLEQRNSLIENILGAYSRSLPGYQDGVDIDQLSHGDPPALFLPADVPLITSAEIREFISKSDMGRYDYCLGVTSEEVLTPFYPKGDQPGIKMAYVYLRNQAFRLNNLHLARPLRVGAGRGIQNMYDHRYQKYLGNRIRIMLEILKRPGWLDVLTSYLLAQGAVFFAQSNWPRLAAVFRRPFTLPKVEREIGRFLETRFKVVETTIGSAALDIDDEESYRTLSMRFREWRGYFAQYHQGQGEGGACPFRTEACG
jgi:GTP:adenosylcobinamide-phosphate guanylyltransferase